MYIDLGRTAATTATLKVDLAASSASAKWNILTRQIECDTRWTAPDGCTMWLTGVSNSWSMYGFKVITDHFKDISVLYGLNTI